MRAGAATTGPAIGMRDGDGARVRQPTAAAGGGPAAQQGEPPPRRLPVIPRPSSNPWDSRRSPPPPGRGGASRRRGRARCPPRCRHARTGGVEVWNQSGDYSMTESRRWVLGVCASGRKPIIYNAIYKIRREIAGGCNTRVTEIVFTGLGSVGVEHLQMGITYVRPRRKGRGNRSTACHAIRPPRCVLAPAGSTLEISVRNVFNDGGCHGTAKSTERAL